MYCKSVFIQGISFQQIHDTAGLLLEPDIAHAMPMPAAPDQD